MRRSHVGVEQDEMMKLEFGSFALLVLVVGGPDRQSIFEALGQTRGSPLYALSAHQPWLKYRLAIWPTTTSHRPPPPSLSPCGGLGGRGLPSLRASGGQGGRTVSANGGTGGTGAEGSCPGGLRTRRRTTAATTTRPLCIRPRRRSTLRWEPQSHTRGRSTREIYLGGGVAAAQGAEARRCISGCGSMACLVLFRVSQWAFHPRARPFPRR